MGNSWIKKTFKWTGSIFLILLAILAVHIYVVTRHRVDSKTRVMARIDVKQFVSKDDANKITEWFYKQQGVDHVLCNPKTEIVIFTFSPLIANANKIVENFKAEFNYKNSIRYIPSEEELDRSCPVAASFTYKAVKFIKHIF
jgi:hypothetical protein